MQTVKSSIYQVNSTSSNPLGWIHLFMLGEFALQIMLLIPAFSGARAAIRVTSFGLSLLLLVWLPANTKKHPCVNWALAVLLIMGIQFFFHDDRNNINSGLAQWTIYLAIIAPVFWVTRLKITANSFYWLILMIWGFHTLSSAVGVLQVLYPGQYQGALSTAITESKWGGENLKIVLANGEQIYRPMGLTDAPGGAAGAGFYAVLCSVGIAIYESKWFMRVACLFSSAIGFFCIYLSQVRSTFVTLAICLICFVIILYRQDKFGKLAWLMGSASGIGIAAFTWASQIGGESTVERFSSLFEKNADQVYQENRGHFLQSTINAMFEKPFGYGLGRWGPISGYFGRDGNPFVAPVWVEIQWTAWLVDGGVPMIITYVGAIFVAMSIAWAIAMNSNLGDLNIWGGLILAYDIGTFAGTFNYVPFIGQTGMEFWLLNVSLFMAASNHVLQSRRLAS
jgi:O-Antigen ligase